MVGPPKKSQKSEKFIQQSLDTLVQITEPMLTEADEVHVGIWSICKGGVFHLKIKTERKVKGVQILGM